MSVYHGKLLELLSINRESDKSFLQIKLLFEKEVELLWEIDDDTAENLKAVTEFAGVYKYRLSLHSSWDSIKKQNISFLTRTYRDQSERIYFPCTGDYVAGLDSIKHLPQINKLHTLTSSSIQLPVGGLEDQEEVKPSVHYNRRFAWIAAAMICATSSILLGYSSYSYMNKPALSQQAPIKIESAGKEISAIQGEKQVQSVNGHTTIDSTIKSSIPSVELNEVLTYSIPKGSVALTFDDGPSKYSIKIVDILKKYQVGGTFFFTGHNVKKYPSYVQYVHSNGYSIGSHSMNHLNLTRLSYAEQENELIQTNQLIEAITLETVVLFRPPYGAMNEIAIDLMHNHSKKMVLWNMDPEDWKGLNSEEIFNHVRHSRTSGAIILLHESQAVVDALPKIIEYLQGQDLQIINLK